MRGTVTSLGETSETG